MRDVEPSDVTTPPLADVGTLDSVTLASARTRRSERAQAPAGPEARTEAPEPASGPEDAPGEASVEDEAERMRAAGFQLVRGAWRR
jgi:hypothetical protein